MVDIAVELGADEVAATADMEEIMQFEILLANVSINLNLPSAQVVEVVKKQGSSFQSWEISRIPKIYSSVVEYKARQVLKRT